jgi:hypothetical protein
MAVHSTNPNPKTITLLPIDSLRSIDWTKRKLVQGKRGKPCVYCGGAAPGTTMDHVFAKTLFDPVPRDAITVQACKPCNELKAVGDEALHVVVTVSNDAMRSPADITHFMEIARAVQRNRSPVGIAAWQAVRIRKQVDPLRLGGPFPVHFDGTALNTTLEMIVRGLFFKVHGRILPASCSVTVMEMTQSEAPSWLRVLVSDPDHHMGQRGEMDVQWVMSSTDFHDEHSAMCVLLFKRGVFYLGTTGEFARDEGGDA